MSSVDEPICLQDVHDFPQSASGCTFSPENHMGVTGRPLKLKPMYFNRLRRFHSRKPGLNSVYIIDRFQCPKIPRSNGGTFIGLDRNVQPF